MKDNPNISDIGAIMACLKDDVTSLQELKDECTSIDEFLDIASRRANVALVTAAIEAAIGYNYEEWEQKINLLHKVDEDGKITTTEIPGEKKVKHKHAKKNDQLLKYLLTNRLPEYFSDTKKIEINKKSIEIKANTEEEIKSFCGRLLDVIDVEFTETN